MVDPAVRAPIIQTLEPEGSDGDVMQGANPCPVVSFKIIGCALTGGKMGKATAEQVRAGGGSVLFICRVTGVRADKEPRYRRNKAGWCG